MPMAVAHAAANTAALMERARTAVIETSMFADGTPDPAWLKPNATRRIHSYLSLKNQSKRVLHGRPKAGRRGKFDIWGAWPRSTGHSSLLCAAWLLTSCLSA